MEYESLVNQKNLFGDLDKKIDHKKARGGASPSSQRKHKRTTKEPTDSNFRQLKIVDYLKKAGAMTCQEEAGENPSGLHSNEQASDSADIQHCCDSNEQGRVEVSAVHKALDLQKFKFRGLTVQCCYIVANTEVCDLN